MKAIRTLVIGVAIGTLAACTNMTPKQQGTMSGAAIGGAAGAGIAAIAGGSAWTGAAIGAVAGGVAGNIRGGIESEGYGCWFRQASYLACVSLLGG
ncbi:Uncharacterised protein [Achromobacter denitrificans]|nr:Uncharacterised protein [Achromobacter denitrificans]